MTWGWVLALALASCTAGKTDPNDDFSGIGDEKSDSFSKKMTIVATLTSPSGDVAIPYSSSPIYRAIKLKARTGDWLKITVKPGGAGKGDPNTNGDPVAWLLDSTFKVVAKNDDVTKDYLDSQIVVRLKKTGTFYVLMRDYNYAAGDFTAHISFARPSGTLLTDANSWFSFFIASDDYSVVASKFEVDVSSMPQAAQDDAAGFFARDVGNASGYKFPYDDTVMYMLTGSAEEAYDAAAYDDSGRAIAPIAIGGDVGDIVFGVTKGASGTKTKGGGTAAPLTDPDAATEAVTLGFKQYWKCPDDTDVTVLGDTATMTACWSACEKEGGAGCWFLDGTGGFARECRVCRTLVPVKETWSNDWARKL
jgi:hypothetical protein